MKMLELYSGTGSISKEFEKLGFKVFTIDNDKRHNPSMVADISKLKVSDLPSEFQHPDVVWASPDCRYFSVAALSRNWELKDGKYIPRRKEAEEALKLLERTVEIIDELNPKYWFIENPRGMMRKMAIMESLPIRSTICYCQYGDSRQKPTDIFHNCNIWTPRPMCKPKAPCHVSAPRGSTTGTQGLKNAMERSRIPSELGIELATLIKQTL
ncbi:MAG: DNA cytosine methyltransferase [bacterium]